jgi:hypothetical protein
MFPAIAATAGLLGKVFGSAGQGAANQRITENQQRLQQQQMQQSDILQRAALQSNNANTRAGMANDNAQTRASMQNSDNQFRAGLDLQRKQFTQREPSVQARQALAGSLLSRIQPLEGSSANSIINALGPEAREAGSLLAERGVSGLRSGPSQFADIPGVSLPDVTLPELLNMPPALQAQMKKSGLLEKILGGLGLAGSAVGVFGDYASQPTSGNGLPIDPVGGG